MEKFGSTMRIPSVLAAACAQPVIGRVVTAPRAFGFPQEKSALGRSAGQHVSLILGTTETYMNKQSTSSPKLDGFRGVPPRGRPV